MYVIYHYDYVIYHCDYMSSINVTVCHPYHCDCFLISASNANDELEFVKMYQTPSRPGYQIENQTFENETETTDYPTLDHPPSYETSMRNQANRNRSNSNSENNNIYSYGADRQSVRSVRSTRSTRSKASNKSKATSRQTSNSERREELPWVQITPSPSSYESPFRHYP
jgi:hypothetical protein